MTIINIRASSLNNYPDCDRRTATGLFSEAIETAGFRLRRLTTGVGAAVGQGAHAAAAHLLTEKMETGKNPEGKAAIDHAEDIAMESFKIETELGVIWDSTTPRMDAAHHQIRSITREMIASVVPAIEPIEVEKLMEAAFPVPDDLAERGISVIVSGHPDALERAIVDDHKTGAVQRPNAFQFGLYSLLARTTRGLPIAKIREYWVPRVAQRAVQPKATVIEYDVAEAEKAATAIITRIIRDFARFLETEDPWSFMANPQSMLCSEKYCAAFNTDFCRVHRGAKRG